MRPHPSSSRSSWSAVSRYLGGRKEARSQHSGFLRTATVQRHGFCAEVHPRDTEIDQRRATDSNGQPSEPVMRYAATVKRAGGQTGNKGEEEGHRDPCRQTHQTLLRGDALFHQGLGARLPLLRAGGCARLIRLSCRLCLPVRVGGCAWRARRFCKQQLGQHLQRNVR